MSMNLQRPQLALFLPFVALLSATCFAQPTGLRNQHSVCVPAGTPAAWRSDAPPLKSPDLSADGHVALRLCAPNAQSVGVIGAWNARKPMGDPLTRDAHGVWSISIGPLKPDMYTYSFFVDGVKTIDPSNVHSANGDVRIASFFIVGPPGAVSRLYEDENVPHGELAAVWYASKYVASPRRALVYTPPNYREGTKRYPVLYLLHGWGGDENEWPQLGRLAQIMDNLIAAHKIVPMIVVMPNGHSDRHAVPDISAPPSIAELAPLPPRGYDITPSITGIAKSVVYDLVPYVDRNFRTIPNSSSRAIGGLSMGGAQALYIGLNHPNKFAWVASFSGAIIAWPGAMAPAEMPVEKGASEPLIPHLNLNTAAITQNVPDLNESINGKLRLLYISCGGDDGLITSMNEFEAWLSAHKIHYTKKVIPGYGHVWSVWRKSLVDVAPSLFRPAPASGRTEPVK